LSNKIDIITTPERSQLMSRVRQSGTAAELAVRKIVDSCGVNFQTEATDLPGTPDLVNRERRWVIFVNGCFWHAHENCPKGTLPKSNRAFWEIKFADNRRRDEKNVKNLEKMGYSVLVVWECELKDETKLGKKIKRFLIQIGAD
jgi:DNA mismatch endonuclease (patch repair protein)